ncbi:MAG: hypothetical protein LBQ89_00055 [Treponema sp.]|nr:hypothetical protein [Treponema sp.]
MKKIICVFLILAGSMPAFAQIVTGSAPVFGTNDPALSSHISAFNTEIAGYFSTLFSDLNSELGNYNFKPKPENLIRAFGTSAAYASHGATQRGFGGFNTFAATLGTMVGLQLPFGPFELVDKFDVIAGDPFSLFKDGDLTLGINPQALNAQVSLNTSGFFMKNMYLGVRVGYMNLPDVVEGLSVSNMLLGVTVNYQLLPKLSLAGLITWRGLSLGTGFIFQNTKLGYYFAMDSSLMSGGITTTGIGSDISYRIEPRVGLDMDITTYTIPIEVVTAIKLLFLNIPFGAGVDLAFGKSDIRFGAAADINFNGLPNAIYQSSPGSLAVNLGGEMSPSFVNLKIMSGLGLVFGPLIIDIPITWYVMDNGFNVGLTFGVAF